MASTLNTDNARQIALLLDFPTLCALRTVSSDWYGALSDGEFERAYADRYAACVLGDPSFWTRALARPSNTRKSLATFHREIARIEAGAHTASD
jgi:hypothetical protein